MESEVIDRDVLGADDDDVYIPRLVPLLGLGCHRLLWPQFLLASPAQNLLPRIHPPFTFSVPLPLPLPQFFRVFISCPVSLPFPFATLFC